MMLAMALAMGDIVACQGFKMHAAAAPLRWQSDLQEEQAERLEPDFATRVPDTHNPAHLDCSDVSNAITTDKIADA